MANNVSIDDAVEVFNILGDKTRVKILLIIDKEETCVFDLVNALGISQPAISQHLRKMRRLGFIQENKSGKWSYYKTHKNNPTYFLLKDILSKISVSG